MSDCHISSESRKIKLNQERQKIKDNMNKKHVQHIKHIQTTDNNSKVSIKFCLLKDDNSPLLTEENNKVKSIIHKFAYDGPQSSELIDSVGENVNVMNMANLLPADEERHNILSHSNNRNNGTEPNSTFNYIPLNRQLHVDDSEDEDILIEEWSIIKTDNSADTLTSQIELPDDRMSTMESIDTGHSGSGSGSLDTSGIAIAPCVISLSPDNTGSSDDIDSIQLDRTNDQDGGQESRDFVDTPDDLEDFVTSPAPEDQVVKCHITRDKQGVDKGMHPVYYLHLERSDSKPLFLLAARRRKMSKTSNYLISCDPTNLNRGGTGILAKLRSNFVGTNFTIFDNGENPKYRKSNINKPKRKQLVEIMYEANVLGFKGPRKMTIIIPGMTNEKRPVEFSPGEEEDGLIECWRKGNTDNLKELHNKTPVWNEGSQTYVLNFSGRVTQSSVKNFQIVNDNDVEYIVMQFGRTSINQFSMDYSYPLSAVQAFGIALSSLDGKLACE